MTATVLFLAVLVLLGYVVQRHHRRYNGNGMAGTSTADDRDAERMRTELNAANAHYGDGHGRAHAGGNATREVGLAGGRR
ncbi:MAG TPA: hypothetical protein VGD84_22275 [Pseudonocardiaceae bacterium]